jgi:hypothetical protein
MKKHDAVDRLIEKIRESMFNAYKNAGYGDAEARADSYAGGVRFAAYNQVHKLPYPSNAVEVTKDCCCS